MFFTFAILTEHLVFGKRCDKNPLVKYFTAEDFCLSAEPVSLQNGLNGFIYKKDGILHNGKLIIFCHGMGPGHIAYTTEIAFFCNNGFTVLAVDSRGCNFSEGKNLKGMYSGVQTVIAAIDFAKTLHYNKVFLVGHSWGAYSALCASAKRKVDGVVAISAPATPAMTICDGAAPIISKPLAYMLRPFLWLVNLFKFGAKGNSNAAKAAEINGVPSLLIHGDNDRIVRLKNSAFAKAEGKNVTKLLAKGKAHNPYNTADAEKLLAELTNGLKSCTKDFSSFDFTAATQEDGDVMRTICDFISR